MAPALRISLLLASLLASFGSAVAQTTTTVPIPASSADSGRRAVVAVTPVDTSSLATKTEVNNVYNYAVAVNNNAAAAQTKADAAYVHAIPAYGWGRPWAQYFVGQYVAVQGCAGTTVHVDGNGLVYVNWPYASGYFSVGYTHSGTPITVKAGSGSGAQETTQSELLLWPVANSAGVPYAIAGYCAYSTTSGNGQ